MILDGFIFNPVRYLRRRRRLNEAIEMEVAYLRRLHGEHAYAVAVEKHNRPTLTRWGRKVMKGVVKRLRPPRRRGRRTGA
ncbi:MAG: hypothetical protein WDM92_11015 [Caulobacteraceae bacterium]